MATHRRGRFSHQSYGACGIYSIRHALLLLGQSLSIEEIRKATGKSKLGAILFGIDHYRIILGLRRLGFKPEEYEYASSQWARKRIERLLREGIPIILSVRRGNHWIVLRACRGGKYFYIDSADEKLTGCSSWEDLLEWVDGNVYIIGVKAR